MIIQHARPMYDQRKWLLGKIHDVANRLGMDDPTRRDFMMSLVGENSCRDMSNHQLKKVLYALTHKSGAEIRRAAVGAHGGAPMASIGSLVETAVGKLYRLRSGRDERLPDEVVTVEQTRMIEHLFTDIETVNPGLARTWRTQLCKRQCGRVWPQTRAQANKIVEALKAMRLRGWRVRTEVAR